ncbi:MAG TPA: hypothetical protein VL598_03180, partial [Trinickia sp.]|jgi:hypothetical protein|uniref:hypothetical protein n=1 Tax=Trinickia sp. TaxID=2571163 RepID=UPI002C3E8B37
MSIELSELSRIMGRHRARLPSIHPCALVYLDGVTGGSPNSSNRDPRAYVRQALCLNKSLLRLGMPRLNVYTNEPDGVRNVLAGSPDRSHPVVHALTIGGLNLPDSTPFYATHFKFHLMMQAARTLPGDTLFLLLDTDMAAMRALDVGLVERCARLGVGAFDISDQVFPCYGSARVIADIEAVAGRRLQNPRWYGGEFLLCTPHFLARLVACAKACFDRYTVQIPQLCQHGDEAFVSAALSLLAEKGQSIVDVGAYQAVGRHWPGNTHRNLYWFSRCAFLHLPGSKSVIERQARFEEFDPARLWRTVCAQHRKGQLRWVLKLLLAKGMKSPKLRE